MQGIFLCITGSALLWKSAVLSYQSGNALITVMQVPSSDGCSMYVGAWIVRGYCAEGYTWFLIIGVFVRLECIIKAQNDLVLNVLESKYELMQYIYI